MPFVTEAQVEMMLQKVAEATVENDQSIVRLISTLTERLLAVEDRLARLEALISDLEEAQKE